MVADDEMLKQSLEFGRKAGDQSKFCLQHLKFNDHVPEKLASRSVGKRAIVGKFVDLADVVKKCAGQQQIAVDLGIVSADQVAGTKKRNHMVEQATDIGVMQGLGGGSIAVSGSDFRIRHEGLRRAT